MTLGSVCLQHNIGVRYATTCPKGLNPAKAIAEIKKMMLERAV